MQATTRTLIDLHNSASGAGAGAGTSPAPAKTRSTKNNFFSKRAKLRGMSNDSVPIYLMPGHEGNASFQDSAEANGSNFTNANLETFKEILSDVSVRSGWWNFNKLMDEIKSQTGTKFKDIAVSAILVRCSTLNRAPSSTLFSQDLTSDAPSEATASRHNRRPASTKTRSTTASTTASARTRRSQPTHDDSAFGHNVESSDEEDASSDEEE